MRILFVTPNSKGSGEAITALHIAEELTADGEAVRFLSSEFTARFLSETFADRVVSLTEEAEQNRSAWNGVVEDFEPDAVVFADYPLLFSSPWGRTLAASDWVAELEHLDVPLFTLDHLGMAQGPMTLHFGPPHLSPFTQHFPGLPGNMRILLPSPLQEPSRVEGRVGSPFRCWQVPLGIGPERRRRVRRRYLDSDHDRLVFHSVPSWALEFARAHALPHYQALSRLFEEYLAGSERPITLVSVNDGCLLPPSSRPGLRIANLGSLSKADYEELLFASDLMITDNRVSVSLGKAACALVPCVALRNSFRLIELHERAQGRLRRILSDMEATHLGSVFPFEVFPIWTRVDLETMGVFRQNSLASAHRVLELFGGEETGAVIRALLFDEDATESLRSRQSAYVEAVSRLPAAGELLRRLVETC